MNLHQNVIVSKKKPGRKYVKSLNICSVSRKYLRKRKITHCEIECKISKNITVNEPIVKLKLNISQRF